MRHAEQHPATDAPLGRAELLGNLVVASEGEPQTFRATVKNFGDLLDGQEGAAVALEEDFFGRHAHTPREGKLSEFWPLKCLCQTIDFFQRVENEQNIVVWLALLGAVENKLDWIGNESDRLGQAHMVKAVVVSRLLLCAIEN